MSNESVIILGTTVKKDDIVKIKFKPLEHVLQDARVYCRISRVVENYEIDSHMTSFVTGGHFKVLGTELADSGRLRLNNDSRPKGPHDPNRLDEIRIEDFNTGNWWTINEVLIESISVENEVGEYYFSEEHQLALVLIEGQLHINGKPLTSANSKILEMFEKVLAEAAINNVLSNGPDSENEDIF